MARYLTTPPAGANRSNPLPSATLTARTVGLDDIEVSDLRSHGKLKELVTSSQAYRDAYALFSSSPDFAHFLVRLEAIPDSVLPNEKTWLDEIGVSNKYNDKFDANYQYCMEQINLLLAEFHEWYNSLPITQVEQYQDAGINAKITGSNITGSSLNPQSASTDPSSKESTNPLDYISSLADIAFNVIPNAVTSVASTFKTINDVRLANKNFDLNNQDFLSSLWTTLSSQGYNMAGFEAFGSYDDFKNWSKFSQNDPYSKKRFNSDQLESIVNEVKSRSFEHALIDRYDYLGEDFDQFYSEYGNLMLDQFVLDQEYNTELSRFNAVYQTALGSDGASLQADLEKLSLERQQFQAKFETNLYNERIDFYNRWIEKAHTSRDPIAKLILFKAMTGDSLLQAGTSTVSSLSSSASSAAAAFSTLKKLVLKK